MLEYLIKRILQVIPILLIVSLLIVCLTRLVPGDPVRLMLGEEATVEQYDMLRAEYGLDKSIPGQYVDYMKKLFQGDMGRSYFKHLEVTQDIGNRYPNTFKLAFLAALLATVVGIVFGVVSALNRGNFIDSILIILSLIMLSLPIFFLSIILMVIFGVTLKILPIVGLSSWKHYIMPVVALAGQSIATITRSTRSAMLDVLNEDYIRTGRACGIPNRVLIYKNAMRNAMIPVITTIGIQFGGLMTGAVITETVFSINGMGTYMVDGVLMRDYPVVQGAILMFAIVFVVVNLITDLTYGLIDPRVSYK